MYLGYRLYDASDDLLAYAKQTGADGGLLPLDTIPAYEERGYPEIGELAELREQFGKHGLRILAMILHHSQLVNVLLGKPGRDEEIDNMCKTLEAWEKWGWTL